MITEQKKTLEEKRARLRPYPDYIDKEGGIQLCNDSYQNWKSHGINEKAQLILSDIPYAIGTDAYGSNPMWYEGGDNKNGESKLAGKAFFDTDYTFRVKEFLHFSSQMLKPEPKNNDEGKAIGKNGKKSGGAPCMVIFCSFEQQWQLIETAKEFGFKNYINLVFRKNYSAQVLKANMRIVGNCEYAVLFYRNRLPKFNNNGQMIFNCFDWVRDNDTPKVHPTQKSVPVLERLIEIFTDEGDVVIDPCAGSGTTLLAAANLRRKAYGFEIKKDIFKEATTKVLPFIQRQLF